MPIAELRRRFALDEPDAVSRIERDGQVAYVGLPEREATKIADLWGRDEIGVELSVEVRAPAVVGIYPLRIARFLTDGGYANGHPNGNGIDHAESNGHVPPQANGHPTGRPVSTDASRPVLPRHPR